MIFIEKIQPVWALRLGLGLMYLYSGMELIYRPAGWHWALPYWLKNSISGFMPIDSYLRLQGEVELVLAVVLLAWFLDIHYVRWAALLSALEMAGILVLAFLPFSSVNFLQTFRDIGLLGSSLALARLLSPPHESKQSA